MARHRRPNSLSRSVGSREPKKRVLVVCEGSKTEPDYLSQLSRRSNTALIQLELVDTPHTAPKKLVEVAVELKREIDKESKKAKDSPAKRDEVWCVFDVDQHLFLKEAIDQAGANGVRIALSNPSIEVWFLLHLKECTGFLERDDARRRLEAELGTYAKGQFDLTPLLGKYEVARARAKALDVKHAGDGTLLPHNNPSSGVWDLVETLKAAY